MIGEVIAIGDELTSGQRLDTNSQWLSQRLGDLGVQVMFHSTVGDDLAANVRVFREAAMRAGVIVCTGGLGPTADDLTRQALAAAAGVDLIQDDAALEHIRNLFVRRGREMPERNILQAMFPAGSRVVPNPHGSAPGIDMDFAREGRPPARVFALPGVPAEMKEMWQATVEPAIAAMLPPGERRVIRHRRLKCFGVGESDLEQMLPDLIRRGRDPQVGITVSKATITLRVTASRPSPEECYAAMESTIDTIRQCLGNLVFGEEDDELQHVVARTLAARGQTLATAEWGTRGLLTQWLTNVPEARATYRGGIVVSGEGALVDGLNIPSALIRQHGHHSRETAVAMAQHCRDVFRADYALAVTDLPDDDAGNFFLALATPEETIARPARTLGHPEILHPRSAKQALDLLRLTLIKNPSPSGRD